MKPPKPKPTPEEARAAMLRNIERARQQSAVPATPVVTQTAEEKADWRFWIDVELPAYRKAIDALNTPMTDRQFKRRYPGLAALYGEHGKKLFNTLDAVNAETVTRDARRGAVWHRQIAWLRQIDVVRAMRKRPK
jgi:hypothetical protein